MSTVPLEGYDVEFIPLERRLVDRRKTSANALLPPGLKKDRRASEGRRRHDFSPAVQTKTVQ